MDGWILWNTTTYPATTAFSTTGVTLGFNSLQLTSAVTYGQNLAIRLQNNGLVRDFLINKSFSIDVTWLGADWSSSTADNWAVIDLVINASGIGWSNQGKPDRDTANVGYPGGWDTQNWGNNTRTVTWDYGHLLDGNPANGEITATPTSGFVEIIILTTYAGGFLPPNGRGGIYYFDNAQLIGGVYKTAHEPYPSNGATDVKIDPALIWKPGVYADTHDVYFGSDFNDVNNAAAASHPNVTFANIDVNSFKPGTLELNITYYWRIDEVNDLHPEKLWKGNVWSFTTGNFLIVDDFEDYNDFSNKIFITWEDYAVNNTGMTVGHLEPPFAEQRIVHTGYQSMYMRYDNDGTVNEGTDLEQKGTLLYSEAQRQWAEPQDWTKNDANSLSLWFRGVPASVGGFSTTTTGYTMTASGADIYDTADQCHFAYIPFTGAGEIIAKVESIDNTNAWAKAGVMIRETLDADSAGIALVVTPGNGVSMQHRSAPGAGTEVDNTVSGLAAPRWLKLSRNGNTFKGEYSGDKVIFWRSVGSVQLTLRTDVFVGLCLTSHNVNATCAAKFSNVTINSAAPGNWSHDDIGIESNVPGGLYVVLEDGAGISSPAVTYSNPAATTIATWTPWNIPLSAFSGVNLGAVKKMVIGAGTRGNTQPGGSGTLYIDDIRLLLPAPAPEPQPQPTPTPEPEPQPEPAPEPALQPVDPGADGLVAYYAFENNTEDSSSNKFNGTIVGNPAYVEGPAGFGTAMDFDGSGDYIDCGADPAFDITGTITVAAWVNIRSILNNYVAIVAKGENAWRLSSLASARVFHFGIAICTV